MAIDSFTVATVVNELNNNILGGKINKVLQPEKDEIILTIYSKKTYRLLLSCGAVYPRLHITKNIKDNPETPYAFCMVLRKYLTGGTITKISQLAFDRVVTFSIENTSEMFDKVNFYLIAEIMGRQSNIILCDNNMKIISAIKTVSLDAKSKTVLAGVKYTYPENNKIKFSDKTLLENTINNFNGSIDETFLTSNFAGLSNDTATYILNKAKIDGVINKSNIIKAIYEFDNSINSGNYKPVIIKSTNYNNFFIFPFNNINGELIYFDSVNECIDVFYTDIDKGKSLKDKIRSLKSIIKTNLKKCEKKIALLNEKLLETNKADFYKKCGELITANIYKIKKGQKSVILTDYYNENNDILINLDENLFPAINAQKYFKKYNKLKNAKTQADLQLKNSISQKDYLLSIDYYLSNAESINEVEQINDELILSGIIKNNNEQKKKKTKDKTMYFNIDIDGFTIYYGKNNIQNDYITFKIAKPNDIWLHAKNYHGSHVIIKTMGKTVTDNILFKAAEIAANGRNKIAIDYTFKKYVKKPNGAKLGFVIYTDYKTITV